MLRETIAMPQDGKYLEEIVAYVERILLPHGFEVKLNSRVVDDDGRMLAEFDIEIFGRVGSTDFRWLIECRDRPSQGAQPGSWIEQLVGRRDRFGFNKVTAVSTTGFAEGVLPYAQRSGIELRDVRNVSVEEFSGWLQFREIVGEERKALVKHATIFPDSAASEEMKAALRGAIGGNIQTTDKLLKRASDATRASLGEAFLGIVSEKNLFDSLDLGSTKSACIRVNYEGADHFLLETEAGDVRVRSIEFIGTLSRETRVIPLTASSTYANTVTGAEIASVATFSPLPFQGKLFALELHHVPNAEMQIVLRKISDK